MGWTNEEFSLNIAFWESRGFENSIPLRFANLTAIFEIIAALDPLYPILTGSTAQNAVKSGGLLEDHDDDLVLLQSHSCEVIEAAQKQGFELIRREAKLFSLYRHHCYIDFHTVDNLRQIDYERVNFLGTSRRADLARKESERPPGILSATNKTWKVLKKSVKDKGLPRTVDSSRKQLRKNFEMYRNGRKNASAKPLTLEEFLDLKFEPESSLNWIVRASQLSPIAKRGQTISEIVENLARSGGLENLERNLIHPTYSHVCSPENLCREYWADGNSFFIYPMLLGFRHAWPGYSAAALISSTIGSDAMKFDSLATLPHMTDSEAGFFLKTKPIEIRDGAVVSGKHRVAGMIGRLMRGEPYLEMRAIKNR